MSGRPPAFTLAEKAAFWLQCWDETLEGFEFFARRCLKIRTKRKGKWVYVPFVLNDEQRTLVRFILTEMAAGRAVRIIVLKSRKLGISTLVQALGFWFASFRPGWKTQTYAHTAPATEEIAQISADFASNLAPFMAARFGPKAKDGGLKWGNASSLRVMTQRSDGASRGSSPSLLHLSEVSIWQDGRASTDDEKPLLAALGSMEDGVDQGEESEGEPLDDEIEEYLADRDAEVAETNQGGTIVVIESTANGARGAFHNRYRRAKELGPKSRWTPFFFPWQKSRKHQYPLTPADFLLLAEVGGLAPEKRVARWAEAIRDYPGASDADGSALEWAQRADEFGLTPAQVRWALAKVDELGGSLQRFDQEFPLSEDHAFLSTGKRVISEAITKLIVEPEAPRPIRFGLLTRARWQADPAAMLASMVSPGAEWTIWHMPERTHKHRYAVVTDAAGGVGEDNASIRVLDRVTRREVAELYSAQVSPDELALQAQAIGYFYGLEHQPAMIADEINNHGVAVVAAHRREKYPAVYRRDHAPVTNAPDRDAAWVDTFGWQTDKRNRPQILTRLARALRSLAKPAPEWHWYSQHLKAELATFVQTKTGKWDHEPGKHSDSIMTAAIGLAIVETMPPVEMLPPVFERVPGVRYADDRRKEPPKRRVPWFASR